MNSPTEPTILQNIKDIVQSVVLLINLILIIYFYNSNKHLDKRKRINDKKSIWFRQVLLEPHLQDITNFYNEINKTLLSFDKWLNANYKNANIGSIQKEIQKTITNLNKIISNFNKEFIDLLLSIDEKFAKKLFQCNEGIRDEVTELLGNVLQDKDNMKGYDDVVRKHKIQFIKELFDYDNILI